VRNSALVGHDGVTTRTLRAEAHNGRHLCGGPATATSPPRQPTHTKYRHVPLSRHAESRTASATPEPYHRIGEQPQCRPKNAGMPISDSRRTMKTGITRARFRSCAAWRWHERDESHVPRGDTTSNGSAAAPTTSWLPTRRTDPFDLRYVSMSAAIANPSVLGRASPSSPVAQWIHRYRNRGRLCWRALPRPTPRRRAGESTWQREPPPRVGAYVPTRSDSEITQKCRQQAGLIFRDRTMPSSIRSPGGRRRQIHLFL